ncbi:ABC transporter permease [Paludibaculum fermentans]|uniref:ABC transporter permease n=1 Tax=Paludibaculum fermentans TaxID=1473598 RepID=A0A7S7NVM7_PALFE|nr:ABC transporter permease [Paludibaculum fermentans]QOY90650.1 ABC transporter permease [Paludibaculum fermentans]
MLADLRHSLRTLLRNPRFTFLAIAVLALGIGATSAMFSVVYSVLWRPLPYQDPSRLMVLLGATQGRGDRMPVPPGDFNAFRSRGQSFSNLAAAELWSPTLTGVDQAEELHGLHTSASLFDVLGVPAALGRTFAPDDDRPGAPKVVVLSHQLWQRRFGADPAILGRTIRLSNEPHTVIGVMPKGFYFPPFWANKAELYAAPAFGPDRAGSHTFSTLRVFTRLKPGVSLEQARSEAARIAASLAEEFPRSNQGRSAALTPLSEISTGKVRLLLIVMFAAVAATLLIACANLANLLLARAAGRAREIAVRQSLGAQRGHLVRQFLSESVLLACAGGAIGLLFAIWAVPALLAHLPESGVFQLPRSEEVGVGAAVVVFNFAVCLITGLLFGIAPALSASRCDIQIALKDGSRGTTAGGSAKRFRNALISAEVALALVLLVGAGLLLRTFQNLRSLDPGFQPANVLALNLSLSSSGHAKAELRSIYYQQLLERLRTLPGVKSASAVNHVPLIGDTWGSDITPEGRPAAPGQTLTAVYRVALPEYFSTLGIRFDAGRDFAMTDSEHAPAVAVINRTMARRLWPAENALGKRFKAGDAQSDAAWMTVVGIIRDTTQNEWGATPDNEFYVPFLQDAGYQHGDGGFRTMTLALRYSGDRAALAALIPPQVWSLDRDVAIPSIVALDDAVADSVWAQRAAMSLLAVFAAVSVLMAALGIYAVLSFLVRGRTQELGIRMALGAQPLQVVRLILQQALPPVAIGAAAGLAAALILARFIGSLLYGVKASDPLVFSSVTALILLVATAASLIPARQAAKVDPLTALRAD